MQLTTKGMLSKSLCTVLHHKSIDKITVNDIVTECGFTRQTFYNHFADIYELAQYSTAKTAEHILNRVSSSENWQIGCYKIMVTIQDNKIVFKNAYKSVYRELLEKYIYDIIYDYIMAIVEKKAVGLNVKQEYKDFIAHFYSVAFIAIILEWFRSGMKEDPKNIVKKTSTLLQGDFSHALERFSD